MNRSYMYLLAALVAAFGIYFLERPDQSRSAQSALQRPFARVRADAIARLEIEQMTDGVAVVRDGERWIVRSRTPALQAQLDAAAAQAQGKSAPVADAAPSEGAENFSVDATLLTQALTQLTSLAIGNPVSRNPEHHNTLQVGTLALCVRALDADGKTLALIALGKSGPDYFSNYVRVGDDNEVYLVPDGVRGSFPARVNSWRDKQLWALDADTQIRSIAIVDGKGPTLALHKDAAGNFLVDEQPGAALDRAKLGAWLQQWTKLSAVDFPDGVTRKQAGLETPTGSVTVALVDGTTRRLLIGGASASGLRYGVLDAADAPIVTLPSTLPTILRADWTDWKSAPAAVQAEAPHAR